MFVSEDKNEALIFYYKVLNQASEPLKILKMHGLDSEKNYYFEGEQMPVGGDELMNSGIYLPANINGDFKSIVWYVSTDKQY